MTRKRWLILAASLGVLAIVLTVLAVVYDPPWAYKTLGGPVAVVKGDPPKHGFLGVGFYSPEAKPLTVRSVTKDSGADVAGLRPGDVILAAGNTETPDYSTFRSVTRASSPGDELLLKVRRGREQLSIRVELMSFSEMVLLRERERGNITAP